MNGRRRSRSLAARRETTVGVVGSVYGGIRGTKYVSVTERVCTERSGSSIALRSEELSIILSEYVPNLEDVLEKIKNVVTIHFRKLIA